MRVGNRGILICSWAVAVVAVGTTAARGQNFIVERVAAGLTAPTSVTQAPGDSNTLYVTELGGAIKKVDLTTGNVSTLTTLAARAEMITIGVDDETVAARPEPTRWSILEYLDHTADVLELVHLGIVAVLEAEEPPVFDNVEASEAAADDPAPKRSRAEAMARYTTAEQAIYRTAQALDDSDWSRTAVLDGDVRSVGHLLRHAIHDASHHLHDLGRNLAALGQYQSSRGTVAQISVSGGGVPKTPVTESVIGPAGVEGDRQANARAHGRPFQALCLWSQEVIDGLVAEGHPIGAGRAGENLTLAGLDWSQVRPGTMLQVGDVRTEITAYAIPCAKNNQWFADGNSQRILHANAPDESRLYAQVFDRGVVRTGDSVTLEPPEPR